MDKPAQRPEGRLLAQALRSANLSQRRAAELADISEGRLRQIVSGAQSAGRGKYFSVVAPPETLARLALVLQINSQAIRDAGRPDAADIMEEEVQLVRGAIAMHPSRSHLIPEVDVLRAWIEQPYPTAGGPPPNSTLRLYEDDQIASEFMRRWDERAVTMPRLLEAMRQPAPAAEVPSWASSIAARDEDGVKNVGDDTDD